MPRDSWLARFRPRLGRDLRSWQLTIRVASQSRGCSSFNSNDFHWATRIGSAFSFLCQRNRRGSARDVPAPEASQRVSGETTMWKQIGTTWTGLDGPLQALSFLFHARDKRLRIVSPLYTPLIHVYLARASSIPSFFLSYRFSIGWNASLCSSID